MLSYLKSKTSSENQPSDLSTKKGTNSLLSKKYSYSNHCPFNFNDLPIQTKLKINTPGDRYEQEADRIADRVVQLSEPNLHISNYVSSNKIVQREEKKPENKTPSPEPKEELENQITEPDIRSLKQPFFDRGVPFLWNYESALGAWSYGVGFYKRIGFSEELSRKAANLTTPLLINSQLSVDHPTFWEITDREMQTTTIKGSIPLFDFDGDFQDWRFLPFLQKKSINGGNTITLNSENGGQQLSNKEIGQKIQSTKGKGNLIPKPTKGFMERRFQRDFSKVKIHTDDNAAQLSRELHAKAFTVGNDIYFNRNEFRPDNLNGKKLLAHELVHTVQQGENLSIQRKETDDKEADFCKALQDHVDSENKELKEARKNNRFVSPPHDHESNVSKLNLCKAIQEGRVSDIPNLFEKFVEKNFMPTRGYSRKLVFILSAKLTHLGLTEIRDQLLEHFDNKSTHSQYGIARRKTELYKYLIEYLIAEAQTAPVEEKISILKILIDTYLPIRDDFAAIDKEQLELSDRNLRALSPWMSNWEYYNSLLSSIRMLFTGIQQTIQSLLEAAILELQNNGQSPILEQLKTVLENNLHPALFPDNENQDLSNIIIEITSSTVNGKGRGTVHDAFRTSKADKSRDLGVTTYDPDQQFLRELKMPISHTFSKRMQQIRALGQIYGQTNVLERERPFSKEFSKVDDGERNAQAIGNMGGKLRLHNDNDWRRFVFQKFIEMTNPPSNGVRLLRKTPAEAIHSIIKTLEAYIRAFTVHARYSNVYDIGTNYLNRKFPRTLSGQLVHDCGVFALRVAYILSLVGSELGLRFRFVRLPAHVALVIYGDALPAIIINNNHFVELSATDWNDIQQRWKNDTPTDDSDTPLSPINEDQFVGEITSAIFIEGPSNTPFRIVDIPNLPKQNNQAQQVLWRHYQKNVNPDVFGPKSTNRKSPNFNFQQRYLKILKRRREVHNKHMLTFWNTDAPKLWKQFLDALKGKMKTDSKLIEEGTLHDLLFAHQKNLLKSSEGLRTAYSSIDDDQRAISKILKDNPKLIAKTALLTDGERANTLWVYLWQSYFVRVKKQVTSNAKDSEKQIDSQRIIDNLNPPFIPIEENKIHPII